MVRLSTVVGFSLSAGCSCIHTSTSAKFTISLAVYVFPYRPWLTHSATCSEAVASSCHGRARSVMMWAAAVMYSL